MTKAMIEEIKDFAKTNFGMDEDNPDRIHTVSDEYDVNVTDPWMDQSGRFTLDDAGAVKE